MTTLRQILTQREAGISIRKITEHVHLDRNTVRKYLRSAEASVHSLGELLALPDEQLREILVPESVSSENERHEELQALFPEISKELKRVGVTLQLLWEEYRTDHPDGYEYSQFCYHFRYWRGLQDIPMHFEHKAGEKLFIDFAGNKFAYLDFYTGQLKYAEVFVATLGASQYTFVGACESQQIEHFLEALQNALYFFCGATQGIVSDNLKSAITTSNRYEPRPNESFADLCNHFGMAILPARPRKPRDKPLVEKAVDIAYTRIYARLRNRVFHSLDEVNEAFMELLPGYNDPKFQGREYSRSDLFEQLDKPVLKPLPAERYEIKHFRLATVQKNSHVRLGVDKHFYSVPYRYRGEKVKIAFSHRTVEIYHKDKKIAFHKRDTQAFGYSSIDDHLPSTHRFFQEIWNPDYFIGQGQALGGPAHELITAIFEHRPHPEQAYNTCLGLLRLAQKWDRQRFNDACQRALDYQRYSYRTVKNILEKGLDKQKQNPDSSDQMSLFPEHGNIRGPEYYK